jgi:hypothetical protein
VNARALVAALALVTSSVAVVPAQRASATCDAAAITGPAKAALQAASAVDVKSYRDSQKQYDYMQQARKALDATPDLLAACGNDGFHQMMAQEATTVYRAWNFDLTAGRAMFLAGMRGDCRKGLTSIAKGAVADGWGRLSRVYRERPAPDSYAATRDRLIARAKTLDLTLPSLGDDAALSEIEHRYHLESLSASAHLPPFCNRT